MDYHYQRQYANQGYYDSDPNQSFQSDLSISYTSDQEQMRYQQQRWITKQPRYPYQQQTYYHPHTPYVQPIPPYGMIPPFSQIYQSGQQQSRRYYQEEKMRQQGKVRQPLRKDAVPLSQQLEQENFTNCSPSQDIQQNPTQEIQDDYPEWTDHDEIEQIKIALENQNRKDGEYQKLDNGDYKVWQKDDDGDMGWAYVPADSFNLFYNRPKQIVNPQEQNEIIDKGRQQMGDIPQRAPFVNVNDVSQVDTSNSQVLNDLSVSGASIGEVLQKNGEIVMVISHVAKLKEIKLKKIEISFQCNKCQKKPVNLTSRVEQRDQLIISSKCCNQEYSLEIKLRTNQIKDLSAQQTISLGTYSKKFPNLTINNIVIRIQCNVCGGQVPEILDLDISEQGSDGDHEFQQKMMIRMCQGCSRELRMRPILLKLQ